MKKLKPLIVALDIVDERRAMKLIEQVGRYVDVFKVNHSLYMRYGGSIIKKIQKRKKKIFLDLKFHDIPNTVESAVQAAGELGVYAVSVHISGGISVLKRICAIKRRPKIWGITILTSIDLGEYYQLGWQDTVKNRVIRLARMGASAGIDGIVCSPAEVSLLKDDPEIGRKGITLITPGIRPAQNMKGDDQKRTATPRQAVKDGADFIVVGRPILESPDPGKTAAAIYKEIKY